MHRDVFNVSNLTTVGQYLSATTNQKSDLKMLGLTKEGLTQKRH